MHILVSSGGCYTSEVKSIAVVGVFSKEGDSAMCTTGTGRSLIKNEIQSKRVINHNHNQDIDISQMPSQFSVD